MDSFITFSAHLYLDLEQNIIVKLFLCSYLGILTSVNKIQGDVQTLYLYTFPLT